MDIKAQEELFEKNWEHYSKIMLEDRIPRFEDSVIYMGRKLYEKSNPPFIAAGVNISNSLWKNLQEIQAVFNRVDYRQTYFHPIYFHVTLKEFGWEDKVDIQEIIKKMKKITKGYSSFNIDIRGINCFERVVFAQVFDTGQYLESILNRIFEEFPYLEKYFPFYLPHISLVRIETTEARNIIRLINERYRDIEIGAMNVDEIQVVAARPYLSVGRIEILERIKLR